MSGAVLDVASTLHRRKARTVDTNTTKPGVPTPDVVYHQWIHQLAPLASQHHMSEYCRIKYGHQGCPVSYAPLSLHLPNVVRGLRERQGKYVDQVLWWPCPPAATPVNAESGPLIPAAKQRAALATGGAALHPDLQRKLSDALSESITFRPTQTDATSDSASHMKTSETHPINISPIIPPESLIAISSHLTPTKVPCPVLFEIHLSYSLDRIAGCPHLSHVDLPIPIPPISQHKCLPSNDLRSSLTGAVNAALSTKISLPPLPVPPSRILLSLKRNLKNHTIADGTSADDAADPGPKLTPCNSTHPSTQALSQTPPSRRTPMLSLPAVYALHPFIRPPTAPSPPNKFSKFRTSKFSSTPSSRQGTANQRPLRLGNLLLSSCPGKKGRCFSLNRVPSHRHPYPWLFQQVRLSGPVRGRSAVCRDLDTDLRRMKLLGARCIVCCLDDEELEFLIGASWLEYCQVAHREGLDVLRIPLPEGLAPLSPKSLDADLHLIIERYSLHGVPVLVHCRGGVGRAGLFACCWMLKLGLCGWIETDIPSSDAAPDVAETKCDDKPLDAFQWGGETVVRRDTLQLVERAIEVVRRRRSVKAIETLEQVQFLVEYVDYLRTCGRVAGNSNDS